MASDSITAAAVKDAPARSARTPDGADELKVLEDLDI